MPLASFFEDQLQQLRSFMNQPRHVVRVVEVDPEFRTILERMLAGLDEDTEFPHLLIGHQGVFVSPAEWFSGLQDPLEAQCNAYAADLLEAGIDTISRAKDPSARGPWPFLLRAEQLADALPDQCGALVFILDFEHVEDPSGLVRSIEFLADNVRSPWLKFIVLDERLAPRCADAFCSNKRVSSQTFWCSPQEFERRLEAMLSIQQFMAAADRRRTLAMAAAVASANRNHTKAIALQQQQLQDAKATGSPIDQAMAAYGLGTAQLAAGDAEIAAELFLSACQMCSEHDLAELAPMTYTNLGIALYRLGQFEQAFAALRIGSTFYRAQRNLPGEAFVCDNLALMYEELDRPEEAAKVWRYALGRYDSITNSDMADVREAGRADILAKLARIGQSAGAV
jgi:tetratricopeptide (TPR) repeat protein